MREGFDKLAVVGTERTGAKRKTKKLGDQRLNADGVEVDKAPRAGEVGQEVVEEGDMV